MMDYIFPSNSGWTIYTKSDCPYCIKAKLLLSKENPEPLIVNCDDYLKEDRSSFLLYIKYLIGKEYKTFPMVFKNGTFVGGYTETQENIDVELKKSKKHD